MSCGFSLEKIADCVVIRSIDGGRNGMSATAMAGALEESVSLLGDSGIGTVLSQDMARIHDAFTVVGTPANLARLRASPETADRAARLADSLPGKLSEDARKWAVWGEQGP